MNSDYGVSNSRIDESESCVGVPDLFLAESFFDALRDFESHIFHWDTGKVGEEGVYKVGTAQTFLVFDFERKAAFFEVF